MTSSWGLTVKTKGMKMGDEPSFVDGMPTCDQSVEMVKELSYLGSTISNDGEVDVDVKIRIAKAASVFSCLRKPIFSNAYWPRCYIWI